MQSMSEFRGWDASKVAHVLYTDNDRNKAAAKLQALYRTRHSRKLVHELIKGAYVKEYDPYSSSFYYMNKKTGESSWEKPKNLGSDEMVSAHEEEAARKIQGLYRTRNARRSLQSMIQELFEKRFDEASGYYYYVNKRTGETTWEKPKMLGSSEILTPRALAKKEELQAEKDAIAEFLKKFDL